MPRLIIFIVGPTASGKSEAAVRLAKKLGGEIISCDSMQVYKGMEVITSQPGAALRNAIRHHLIGAVRPAVDYNVSRYRREALRIMKGIIKRGKTPIFVGGTGLYAAVLIDGIFTAKAKDIRLREELYGTAAAQGSAYLHAELLKVDPEAAGKIHPNDTRRIVRALEVFRSTGTPISVLQKQRRGLSAEYDVRIFSLRLPRQELYRRIEARVDSMMRRGLVAEVRRLIAHKIGKTASYAIGIREIQGYLAGEYSRQEAGLLIKKNTRRYSRRQLTWFRKDKRIEWIASGDTIWKKLSSSR